MGEDKVSVIAMEHGQLLRIKDPKAPGGIRIPEPDTVKSDFVNKFQNLSPGRQKLMEKYFSVGGTGEHSPVLAEYFAVALAFTALGALLRETNSPKSMKPTKNTSERVEYYQGPPQLRRMALEKMLKEAMDRLKVLAEKRKYFEESLREREALEAGFQEERTELLQRASRAEGIVAVKLEGESAWAREKEELLKRVAEADAQRGYFFKHMTDSEARNAELQKLRAEDGKANARLVGIYASREQGWKLEKVKLTQEIESLKERNRKLNGQVRTLALQCERLEMSPPAQKNRILTRVKDSIPEKVHPEKDIKIANRTTPAQLDQPIAQSRDLVSKLEKPLALLKEDEQLGVNEGPASESLPQQQEMESELANILKRVGQLKRRGNVGKMVRSKSPTEYPVFGGGPTKEITSRLKEASMKDVRDVSDQTQEVPANVISLLVDAQALKVEAPSQSLDTSDTNHQLDDRLIKNYGVVAAFPMYRDAVESYIEEDKGSAKDWGKGTSSGQLEIGADSFLVRKSSLEQFEKNVGTVSILSGDVIQSASKDRVSVPTIGTGDNIDKGMPVVAAENVVTEYPGLFSLKDHIESSGLLGDKVVSLENVCENAHNDSILGMSNLLSDKHQETMATTTNPEDQVVGIDTEVLQEPEENTAAVTRVSDQQRGNISNVIFENSCELLTNGAINTYCLDPELSQATVEVAHENRKLCESFGVPTEFPVSPEVDSVQGADCKTQTTSVALSRREGQALDRITTESNVESIGSSEEYSEWTQGAGLSNDAVSLNKLDSVDYGAEELVVPQNTTELHEHEGIPKDGSLTNSDNLLQTFSEVPDLTQKGLSGPYISNGVFPEDHMLEDARAESMVHLQETSQDPDLRNDVHTEQCSAEAVVLQVPSESPVRSGDLQECCMDSKLENSSKEATDVLVLSKESLALSQSDEAPVLEGTATSTDTAPEDIAAPADITEDTPDSSPNSCILVEDGNAHNSRMISQFEGSNEVEAPNTVLEPSGLDDSCIADVLIVKKMEEEIENEIAEPVIHPTSESPSSEVGLVEADVPDNSEAPGVGTSSMLSSVSQYWGSELPSEEFFSEANASTSQDVQTTAGPVEANHEESVDASAEKEHEDIFSNTSSKPVVEINDNIDEP